MATQEAKDSKQDEPDGDLKVDFEIEQYIRSLGASSSRVRFVMLAIIISSIAAAAALWGERQDAWAQRRLIKIGEYSEVALQCGLWGRFDEVRELAKYLRRKGLPTDDDLRKGQRAAEEDLLYHYGFGTATKCTAIFKAEDWLTNHGVTTEAGAERIAEKQQEAYINNILFVRTPVLGLTFDINDLGLITGLTFCILMLVMVFYTHRAHENLVLAMWKVRDIATHESLDNPGSRANLLYHALAMEQVFTVPPTLARWNDFRYFRRAHYLLFFTPLVMQALVFGNDLLTEGIGAAYSDSQTRISLLVQAIMIVVVIPLSILCCSHLHADDVLWDRVFLFINPAHRFKGKASWFHWVRLFRQHPPAWGIIGKEEDGVLCLFVSDSHDDVVWKLDTNTGERSKYLHPPHHGHGLFLAADDSVQTYSRGLKSRRGFGARVTDQQVLYWPGEDREGARLAVITAAGESYEVQWSRRQMILTPTPPQKQIKLGGSRFQADGNHEKAGFDSIHAVLPFQGALWVTDGGWVRRVSPDGEVSTWGGRPLAQVVRRERPFLLGIAAVEGRPIGFQRPRETSEKFDPTFLVCDFSLRRVFGVQEHAAREAYLSEPTWSPSGIWIHGPDLYLLEYRAYPITTEDYLRVLRFEGLDFSMRPTVLVSLPGRELQPKFP